ncbi:MAG: hypothetical protein KF888_13235 [Nitrosomonas sp.]|nr:hypothetical protein [Nitrosomonas sp.]
MHPYPIRQTVAYPRLLLFKMLLIDLWPGGLGDESAEDMANANLHVTYFLRACSKAADYGRLVR